MKLIYPLNERQRVLDLCTEENEYQFFISVSRGRDWLEYDDLPIISECEKYSTNGEVMEEAYDRGMEFRKQGLFLMPGHTHSQPGGTRIPPANAGWTIERTPMLRDYRDARLRRTREGSEYLKWRRGKIGEYLRHDPVSPERGRIALEVMERGMWLGRANLISRNGVDFFITNKIGGPDRDVEEDVLLWGGDTACFVCMKCMLRAPWNPLIDFALLARARMDAVGTPSARGKFEMAAMHYDPRLFGRFERIELVG